MSDTGGTPPSIDLEAFIRHPRNHGLVMALVREEARRDPEWFSWVLRKEAQMQGHPFEVPREPRPLVGASRRASTAPPEETMSLQDHVDQNKAVNADADSTRPALFDAITKAAADVSKLNASGQATALRELAEAYAFLVAPSQPH